MGGIFSPRSLSGGEEMEARVPTDMIFSPHNRGVMCTEMRLNCCYEISKATGSCMGKVDR
jgi:hypothetical protein